MEKSDKKEIYLIRGKDGEGYDEFASRILSDIPALVLPRGPQACTIALTAAPPPRVSVIPYKKKRVACVMIKGDGENGNGRQWAQEFAAYPGVTGGYTAEETLPVNYNKCWDDGCETPGAGLLTLFRSRPDIAYETFLERWHNGHTPLSLEIHPLWKYERNVVTGNILPESEKFDGIVEEHFEERKDLTKLGRFFGPFPTMIRHMAAVWKDMNGFIDRKTIEPYFVTEYCICS
jgi:hypothetical protein